MEIKIKVNFPEDDSYIYNIAYIKAMFIRDTIEQLDINYEEKENLRKEILEHLKKLDKL